MRKQFLQTLIALRDGKIGLLPELLEHDLEGLEYYGE